jgi:hypothetical protein
MRHLLVKRQTAPESGFFRFFFAVPAAERDEVLAFLTSLQGDVVEQA